MCPRTSSGRSRTTREFAPRCRRSSSCWIAAPASSSCPTSAGPRENPTASIPSTRSRVACRTCCRSDASGSSRAPTPTRHREGHAGSIVRRGPPREHAIPRRRRNQRPPVVRARLAQLGDFYVNDAFGSAHRAHASTEGVARLPAAGGGRPADGEGTRVPRQARWHDPKRPFVAILGGAKISGKIDVIEALLPKVDRMLIGGAMACTFSKAMGLETGKSLVEH